MQAEKEADAEEKEEEDDGDGDDEDDEVHVRFSTVGFHGEGETARLTPVALHNARNAIFYFHCIFFSFTSDFNKIENFFVTF